MNTMVLISPHLPSWTMIIDSNPLIDKALEKVKFPPSTGSVLAVIQGIRDFEGQLVRAMKGLSQACVLYAKFHGVHVDLEKLQSKKTAAER